MMALREAVEDRDRAREAQKRAEQERDRALSQVHGGHDGAREVQELKIEKDMNEQHAKGQIDMYARALERVKAEVEQLRGEKEAQYRSWLELQRVLQSGRPLPPMKPWAR